MKLYISDDKKLNVYDLPEKVDESFLFPFASNKSNIKNFINIFSKDDSWFFKNDDSINISENKDSEVKLEENTHFNMNVRGVDETFVLYCCPSKDTNVFKIDIQNVKMILIGSSSDNDICYRDSLTDTSHCTISIKENMWCIEATGKTYLNRNIISNGVLKIGDIIFVNGLKIIWMKNFIVINNPLEKVSFSSKLSSKGNVPVQDNNNYKEPTDDETCISLYNEDDYFFRKPRLRTILEDAEVVIDPPPENELSEEVPFILSLGSGMTLLVFSIINTYNNVMGFLDGTKTMGQFIPGLISSLAMFVGSFLFPRLIKRYQRKRSEEREQKRQVKYGEYLKRKHEELLQVLKEQSQILYENNLSSKECYDMIIGNKSKLWEREIRDDDFLTIRVGVGDVPAKLNVVAPQERFTIDEDNLLQEVYSVVEHSKTLIKVPITFNLIKNNISAIVHNSDIDASYINGIILQLLSLHSSGDLKIVFLTSKANEEKWQYLKKVPHCWNDEKTERYFASTEEEMKNVAQAIEKIYNERKNDDEEKKKSVERDELDKEDDYKNHTPYYLIITDNYKVAKNLKFLNKLLTLKKNLGFSLLMFEKSMRNLPNACERFVYVVNQSCCVFEKELSAQKQSTFVPDAIPPLDMDKVIKILANIPVLSSEGLAVLPASLPFLEMYNVGRIEQLNIVNRWKTNNPIVSLQAPIGVHPAGDLFKLDLHEKFHGPHGLIAGSTGSGKSEFIITYILSMAVNYHPDEVQFVLIDYKGGGLAGAFENRETGICIPHLAGTITNLDTSEMNRTLVSIESELKRRQKMFNEVRDSLGESTIDIYKYQKLYREGIVQEPISHLFIISDEFAELKSQQPEFMNQLISTARIGRSLGVHLILATQKPSGVVNDQIWSNSKFKVCLKVQSKSDSMEMLKKPDAASIKEVGRFYLQVGYDELFELGQSAWCGAKYIPAEKVAKKIDDSINFVDNTGDVIKSINNVVVKDSTQNYGEQLTNIVKYLALNAEKLNIKSKKLWLPSIPENIYIGNLKLKYKYLSNPYIINPIIGEYDNPSGQEQGLLTMNLTENGNAVIYGSPGSGKENIITTLVTSTSVEHSPDEVVFYIVDYGAETLKKFIHYPQVGDVIFLEEVEKMNNLVAMLESEVDRRKSLFAEYSGSYMSYIKESGNKIPQIVTIINSYETMYETAPRYEERLAPLFRDGSKYGIYFIATTSVSNGLKSRISQFFNNKYALQMQNDIDYRSLVEAPRGLTPAKKFGRGLVKLSGTYEFQSAFVTTRETIGKTIKEIGIALSKKYPKKAPSIPVMPKSVLSQVYYQSDFELTNVPVGINKNKLVTCTFDFDRMNITPIVTNSLMDNIGFVYGLINLLKMIKNSKVRVIDILDIYKPTIINNDYYNSNFNTIIQQIEIEINKDKDLKRKNIFVIIGLGLFKENLSDDKKAVFSTILNKLKACRMNKIIAFDNSSTFKTLETESWYRTTMDNSSGIWLGDEVSSQMNIRMNGLSIEEKRVMFKNIGYVINNGKHTIIRYLVDKERDTDER